LTMIVQKVDLKALVKSLSKTYLVRLTKDYFLCQLYTAPSF